jgi:hypothetical protein
MTKTKSSITVTVKSFATLREVMDAEIRMEFTAGATICSLLAELTAKYKGLDELVFAAPEISGILSTFLKTAGISIFSPGWTPCLRRGIPSRCSLLLRGDRETPPCPEGLPDHRLSCDMVRLIYHNAVTLFFDMG